MRKVVRLLVFILPARCARGTSHILRASYSGFQSANWFFEWKHQFLQETDNQTCAHWVVGTWPVHTTRNFVSFAKKYSVNAKPFLVRTIFCTHQNFCKRNETSKIPSTSFGGCKNFVRRENPFHYRILASRVFFENYWMLKKCFKRL